MQFVSFAVLGKRIKSIKALLKDPNVPKRKKFLVIFGIIYLLMPIDLIPAPVLIFGFIDDIVLWLFILSHLKDELGHRTIIETTADETEIDDTKTEE